MFLPPTSYQPIAYDYNAEWHESALQKKPGISRGQTPIHRYCWLLLWQLVAVAVVALVNQG